MKLTFRAATQEDFTAFFDTCFFGDRADADLRAVVQHEWCVLLEDPATLSLVVEDGERPADVRLVGCAQMAFVSDRFVEFVHSAQAPRVNVQATHPLPDGSPPLLTPAQVAEGNAGGGLNALLTRWRRADELLSQAELRELGLFLSDAFQAFTGGYHFKEILIEAIGEKARDQALRSGFHVRRDYAAHDDILPPPPAKRPFLMGVTRAEAFQNEGCRMLDYFIYSPPRFGFTTREQELLQTCQTLQDASSEKLAEVLDVPLSSIKNWWRSIYGRVSDVDPDLLPLSASGDGRGPEKRRLLLQYLRHHPEELRPFQRPCRKSSRAR